MEIGAHVWLRSGGTDDKDAGAAGVSSSWGWVPAYIANKEPLEIEINTKQGSGNTKGSGDVQVCHLVRLTLKDDAILSEFIPSHAPPLSPYVGPGHLNSFEVGVQSPQSLRKYGHEHRPDDNLMRSPDRQPNHGPNGQHNNHNHNHNSGNDMSMAMSTNHSSVWAGRGSVDAQNSRAAFGTSGGGGGDSFAPFEITMDVDPEQLKRPEGLDDVKLRNIDTNNSRGLSPQESELHMSNVNDLIHLVHLHEPAILHSLRIRYDQDFIYTNTGPILIAVNPFKPMADLYSEECMDVYRRAGEGFSSMDTTIHITQSGRSLGGNSCRNLMQNESKVNANSNANNATSKQDGANGRLEPHVYQTTDDAYRAMIRGIETSLLMQQSASSRRMSSSQVLALDIPPCNQSILVSGESGAGKTVTTKIVLNYLAVLSKRTEQFQKASGGFSSPSRRLLGKDPHADNNTSSTTNVITIEQQVLQSNPILEAFGNARTIRNDNSSRFGKYIDVHFTANGKLTGATIETYLLEKVRLLQPQQGERNYHVFYQLLQSATAQERSQFYLQDLQPHDFYLLQSSDTYDRRDGVSDAEQHLEMLDAMITIGFDADVIQNLMQLVVAVLFLGQLEFTPYSPNNHEDEGCLLQENEDTFAVSQLLGVDATQLASSLTTKTVKAGLESVTVPLNVNQAMNAKEALIKAVYGAAFDFVVQQTNASIREESGGAMNGNAHPHGASASFSSPSRGATSRHQHQGPAACIGVLDIFGFESFDINTFEQICINYTNEALQQQVRP
jgi:myosin heavy subunit